MERTGSDVSALRDFQDGDVESESVQYVEHDLGRWNLSKGDHYSLVSGTSGEIVFEYGSSVASSTTNSSSSVDSSGGSELLFQVGIVTKN